MSETYPTGKDVCTTDVDAAAPDDLLYTQSSMILEDQPRGSKISGSAKKESQLFPLETGTARSGDGHQDGSVKGVTELQEAASSPPPNTITKSLELRLYTSHFLSTWNSRLFEFGAVLFLASIYPDTLRPLSIYALVRSAAAILFAQPIGSWIDRGNRLVIVRTSIIGQRVSVAVSCGLLWIMEQKGGGMSGRSRAGLFSLVVILACTEKLCSVMNLVSVERDWVVVFTEGNESARRVLNARMRRIDLFCKLLGPLAISSIAIASTLIAIWATLAMSVLSVGMEYLFIEQVYKAAPSLRRDHLSIQVTTGQVHAEVNEVASGHSTSLHHDRSKFISSLKSTAYRVFPISSLPIYFCHTAFLPSFSLSLLYLTVLSFSGQMITYLISVGYSSLHVGIARTVSTVFELSATWIAPRMVKRIGIIRGGIWSLCWQMFWLAAGISWFFSDFRSMGTNSIASATGLAVGVALSRVGLWGFDLCAQNIVQNEVNLDHRGTFSTVEAAFQSLFDMLSYATTIIFSRPDQFQWPVVISVTAVYAAGSLYTIFVRKRRGHLFHAPLCSRMRN